MFGGLNKYAVYAKLFMTLAKGKIYDMNTMGVGEGGLGTHPCRKGVVTMVAAGYNVSPPIVSILHSHWMGDWRGEG